MANEQNEGAKKLAERILEAARADANDTAKAAAAECGEIAAAFEKRLEQSAQGFEKQRADAVRAILERSRTNAELSARKEALQARRAVLDSVFDEAYKELCARSDADKAALYRRCLENEAEGGETVIAAKADQAQLKKIVEDVSAGLQKAGKKALQFSTETADIDNGFILRGGAYEKDCSIKAILQDARAAEEPNVAAILFG